MSFDSDGGGVRSRSSQVILVDLVQLSQIDLHGIGRHQGEPCVDTVLSEVLWKSTQEQAAKHATETSAIRIALAILETPSGHVERGIVVGEEPVATGEGDSVTQDGTTDSVTWAKTSTLNHRLRLFSLKTDIELEVLNIAIELLSGVGDLGVRVPLQERCVGCEIVIQSVNKFIDRRLVELTLQSEELATSYNQHS